MKLILLLLAAGLTGFAAHAQSYSATYATGEKPGDLLVTQDGHLLALHFEPDNARGSNWNKYRGKPSLRLYDAAMKPLREAQLPDLGMVATGFPRSLRQWGGKYWFLYFEPASKNDLGNLVAVEIHPETLVAGARKILATSAELDQSVSFYGGSLEFFVQPAPNGQHIYILSDAHNGKLFLASFDKELNREWIKAEKTTLLKGDLDAAEVDNDGTVYLSNDYKDKGHLFALSRTQGLQEIALPMNASEPVFVLLAPGREGKGIRIAGGYSAASGYMEGVYAAEVKNSVANLVTTRFPDTLVTAFDRDGWGQDKAKKWGQSRSMRARLLTLADGSLSMVGEMRGETIGERTTFRTSGNLLHVHIGKDKPVFTRIPKYRVSAGSTIGDSYFAMPYRSKVLFFYNENLDNLSRDVRLTAENSNTYSYVGLVAGEVDTETGALKRTAVIDRRMDHLLCLPETVKLLSGHVLSLGLMKIKSLGGLTEEYVWSTIRITE